ncbi:type IV toxin-antitoxin system AbiEi family antitoxin domain-containing protein [Mycolicibacterium hodleri]|nr:type IV toxin-antitoxin system AbiEi family antitoxin domain-containing protein [Mycolicibacterium hodleri]
MPGEEIFNANGGLATAGQLLTVMSRKMLASHVRAGTLIRVWHGVYAQSPPDILGRLAGLDMMTGRSVVACSNTAAQLYGFDTEADSRIHVLDPAVRMRTSANLVVHQRVGAPLRRVEGRLVTAPAWTAIEVARTLRRPRALATLDCALRSGTCSHDDLMTTAREHAGRRGIVNVRALLDHADPRAESPMESEARLVFIDGGLPLPELQYEIIDRCGQLWRVDFAWPHAKVIAEYDSVEWHANPAAFKHDRMKTARLQECGWTTIPMVVNDVRYTPFELVARIFQRLDRAPLAG